MKPQYVAKKPIKATVNRWTNKAFSIRCFWALGGAKIISKPTPSRISPCAISLNMTPNRKGNVIRLKTAGLIYLYYGTP